MSEAKPEGVIVVKTGPVRTSGYAIKLRRIINAALREAYKQGRLDVKKVNEQVTKWNKLLYEIFVSSYEVPKEAIVNIQLELAESEGSVEVKNAVIEVWDKDDLMSKTLTKEFLRRLQSLAEAEKEAAAPT